MNVIITGASRGIGLGILRNARNEGHRILAVVRTLTDELRSEKGVDILQVDLRSPEALIQITKKISDWGNLDLLVNNAGVYEKGIEERDFLESFRVNSVAPFLLAQSLLPLLKKSPHPKIVNVTSQMGSIEDNTSGGSYAYRASKAALNMINKSLACDEPWLTTIVIHPGWVQTRMGGSGAPTSVEDSAHGIWKVTSELKKSDSGKFFDYRGKILTW